MVRVRSICAHWDIRWSCLKMLLIVQPHRCIGLLHSSKGRLRKGICLKMLLVVLPHRRIGLLHCSKGRLQKDHVRIRPLSIEREGRFVRA
jgi:hypothetical protein